MMGWSDWRDDWMCVENILCAQTNQQRPQESMFKDVDLNIDYEDSQCINTDSAYVNFLDVFKGLSNLKLFFQCTCL